MLFNEINSRIKLASILIILAYLVLASSKRAKVKLGPHMSHEDSTNCSEFAKFARFNPYSVINEKWFVFYYWAPIRKLTTYKFFAPSANYTRRLKRLFEGNCVLPVQWNVRQLLMEDNNKFMSLLVERSDRGEYWLYPVARVRKGEKITPRDIRLKQTGDNRLLGLLDCVDHTLIVMAKLNDVPPKGKLHEEASRLGYRGTKGKSYLYQGHEWGPIGEADEDEFWDRRKPKTISKDTSTEDKSSEESSEQAEQPTIKPEHSTAKKSKPKKSTVVAPPKPEDDETCVKVMPELWNDPEPNPNPDNLLTQDEFKELDSLVINDTMVIEGPDASIDNKQESNVDKESEIILENDKLHNDSDAYKMKTPESTDNKKESNADKESDNPLENQKLHNPKDVHKIKTPESTDIKQGSNVDKKSENSSENQKQHVYKMETPVLTDSKIESNADNPLENDKLHNHKNIVVHKIETPDSTDNKPESNINNELENPPKNDNPHNHKVCAGDKEPDDDDSCVVCYKSQVQSDGSFIPDSARLMPDTKNNEDAPSKEVPRFIIRGVELPLQEQQRTEEPIPKEPSAKTPPTEVPTLDVPRTKAQSTKEPTSKVTSDTTPPTEIPTPDVPRTKALLIEEPNSKVPVAKTTRNEVPAPRVPRGKTPSAVRSPTPPPQDQTNSSEVIFLTPRTLDDLKSKQ